MINDEKENKIYLIFTYTGTLFSRLLKIATKSQYVHISLSFDKELTDIYSFGRRNPVMMLPAGFIKENVEIISQVFKNTKCLIYEIETDKKTINKLRKSINVYIKEENKYKYDILGLVFILLERPYNRKYYRVCSQFVGKLFQDNNIYDFGKHYSLIRPRDFDKIENKTIIYQGNLNDYLKNVNEKVKSNC